MEAEKTYLGDGVYGDDGVYGELNSFGEIVLTTEKGISVTNRIVLEPDVVVNLLGWLTRVRPSGAHIEGQSE